MKGDPQFVILKHQAWMESADFEDKMLGAIIKEPLSPSTNFVPEAPGTHMLREPQTGTVADFVLQNDGAAAKAWAASAPSIGGYAVAGARRDAVQLDGKLIRIKRIQQLDQFWASLKNDPRVQETVPGWVSFFSAWPVCLVVGLMICEDVEVSFGAEQSRSREGQVELPVGRVALALAGVPAAGWAPAVAGVLAAEGAPVVAGVPAAGGAPAVVATVLARAAGARESATLFKARSGESRIFALELRRVTTALFRRRLLQLKADGPEVDDVRLAGAAPADEDPGLEDAVRPEDLILDVVDPEVYEDMM